MVELDGRPIGDGAPGDAARALQARSASARRPPVADPPQTGVAWMRGRRQDPSRWHGSRERCPRPRPDVVGLRRPHARRSSSRSSRSAKRLIGSSLAHAAAARPGAARRVVRVPAAREARAAGGRLPVRGPAHARRCCSATAVVAQVVRRARGSRDSAKELVDGAALARPGACSRCARARSPPTTAPSTSRSAATSTASRARASTSAAAPTSSARCSLTTALGNVARLARAGALPRRRPDRRDRRRRRGLDRDLRLDAAPPRARRSRGRSRSPATSSSTASPRRSRRPTQLEVAEAALAACLELETAPL